VHAAVCTAALAFVSPSQVSYLVAHPHLTTSLAMFSLTSALGQIFVFWTIRTFDSLTFSTITTTRKFFTIVLSVVYYGHKQTTAQWAAIATVFAGLALETAESSGGKKAGKAKAEEGDARDGATTEAAAAAVASGAAASGAGVRRSSSASGERAAVAAGARRE